MHNSEIQQGEFRISTDKAQLDVALIHRYLCYESYWARNIPRALVEKSISGSLCFGVYHHNQQVGFARVITDQATFAYLADVFILETYRGRGLSKWLMQTIMDEPGLQGLRRWLLATLDAHGLYAQFGFAPLDKPERIMGMKPFDEYPALNS